MELRNKVTGDVIDDQQFRSLFSNTSFSKVISTEDYNEFGYDVILEGQQPTLTSPYQISERAGIEEINGQWFTKYVIGPTFVDSTDDAGTVITASEKETGYRQHIDDLKAENVRSDRNQRLTNSDWTQLADNTADTNAWAAYRQALRDLPAQAGFPHEITWPTEPTT